MDEMKIQTAFLQGIIESIIEKKIENKLGYKIDINFKGPISAAYDSEDETFILHIDADMSIKKDAIKDLTALLL